jgi:hypothetical protein
MENKDLERIEGEDLPLTTRDSQPPLVVDLPDGQKLVVGDLDPGTVIEIATWRGTGRPDSRTNRFMLGVSTNEDEDIPAKRRLPKRAEIDQPVASITYSEDVKIIPVQDSGENYQSNQVTTGLIYSNVNPERKDNHLATTSKPKTGSSKVKTIATWAGSIAAVCALAFVLIVPVGLRFAHPAAGANTALGGANTSIVVVKKDSNLVVGKSVVVDTPGDKAKPIVAIVAAVNDRALLLSTDSGYVQVRPEQLHGKVVAVLPFIGEIAKLFSR